MLKKFLSKFFVVLIAGLTGFLLAIMAYGAFAVINTPTVSNGQNLTTTLWNTMKGDLDSLDSRMPARIPYAISSGAAIPNSGYRIVDLAWACGGGHCGDYGCSVSSVKAWCQNSGHDDVDMYGWTCGHGWGCGVCNIYIHCIDW